MFLHITDAKYLNGFKIEVSFNNGRQGVADLSDALEGKMFEALKDTAKFSSFFIDKELETIVWPNGADLAPEYVFFKAFKNDPALQDQFRQWGYIN